MNQLNIGSASTPNKWLYILLLITLIATAWTALHDDNQNEDVAIDLVASKSSNDMQKPKDQIQSNANLNQNLSSKKSEVTTNTSNLIPWQKLKREPLKDKTYDVFKVHSWVVVPPVKKIRPQPPPPPVAPPAPFTYLGKLENSPGGTLIFLMANNKLFSVILGEKIDQQWRLDVEEVNALRLTYLPLNLSQVLLKSAKPAVTATLPVVAAEVNL
jgi:hypothetical protein